MPRSITQTTHPLSICNYPEEKLITAAAPSSPHYSPWAWAHPQSINLSQGTHQSGLSHGSKAQHICQGNLPLHSLSSSQPVLTQMMFSCKSHTHPNPAPGSRAAVQHLPPAPATLSSLPRRIWHLWAAATWREMASPAWDCPAFQQGTLCSPQPKAPPFRNHQKR